MEFEDADRLFVIHAMKVTKQYYHLLEEGESKAVRLAALSDIVHEMQEVVKSDKELVSA